MCGIAGLLRLTDASLVQATLERMCALIAHRGPDDAGYLFLTDQGPARAYADPRFPVIPGLPNLANDAGDGARLALGHRRLAVRDLTTAGHQPMSDQDGTCWIAYNGELYNAEELRLGLEAAGHRFHSHSDTEVLLHLWLEHGEAAFSQVDGMFAVAIADRRRGRLVLARDRFGIKPLYHASGHGVLAFASEVKALVASGAVDRVIDPAALASYLTFQNHLDDRTLVQGVRILLPGHLLDIALDGSGQARVRPWTDARESVGPLADQDIESSVTEAFTAAVRRQLVSDVPVGAYLSGGMDSGSIVSVASRHLPRMLTFTGGFDLTNVDGIEQGFDERPAAERLAWLLQTEHYEIVLHAGDMPAAMEDLAWHVDDPRVGMCHPNWYVAKLASRFVKVCLAGVGGDELFAGYPWRYRCVDEAVDGDDLRRRHFRACHRLLSPEELPTLLAGDLRPRLDPLVDQHAAVFLGDGGVDDSHEARLRRVLAFDQRIFLHGLLVVEDRVSMAHGLETRVPFLDQRLAALAARIPATRALAGRPDQGFVRSAEGKMVLRRAMRGLLPEEFLTQPKQGFSPPDENWYRGPSLDYIKQILLDPLTLSRPWFDQQAVRLRLEEHVSGRRNHRLLIWSLLVVEMLQRSVLDPAILAPRTIASPRR